MSVVRSLKVTLLRLVGGGAGASEAEEKWSWLQFRRRVVQALPYIVTTIMLVSLMEEAGWFRGFETSHLDTMIRAHPRKMSQDIVVVEISKDDYQSLFKGTSPLDKKKLLDLIAAVQKYNPGVIGVDIDTNDWGAACERHSDDDPVQCAKDCAEFNEKLRELREEAKKRDTVIVWAAVPKTPDPPLELNPGLGSLPLDPYTERLGIPRFPVDEDGSVRHFDGRVEVAKDSPDRCPKGADKDDEKCYLPTFARAIYEAYTQRKTRPDERVSFNFHGDRYQFPAIDSGQFFSNESSEIEDSRKALLGGESKVGNVRKGKVVLIGGGFPEARDEYFTPVGRMEGVKLNALAIQTDLSKGGIHDLNKIGEYFIDLCVSILLVSVFYRFENHPLMALAISAGLVLLAAFVSSVLLFNTRAYWFNFVPVAVGVVFHQFSDMAEGRVKVQRELEKLRELLREQERVEVDVATVEELAVADSTEAGPVEETPSVAIAKVKRAAGGAD